MEEIQTHNHNGINSQKIKTYDVIPSYTMTETQLAQYLSRPSLDGEEFNVYDSTNDVYYKYYYLGQWNKLELGGPGAPGQDGDLLGCTASDNLKVSADAESAISGWPDGANAILKSIKLFRAGTIRVSCDFRRNAGYSSTASFYINGSSVGDALTDSPDTYTTTTRDFTIAIGDLMQIHVNAGQPSSVASVKNFRIYYDTTPLEDQVILN